MKRRDFIRNMAASTAGVITFSGIPVRVLAGHDSLKKFALAANNDHVLIFVQLHGGNDGLNTLIPVSQYNEYYNVRANIAIRDHGSRKFINVDASIPEEDQVGLHPDMMAFKILYDQGKAVIVQNVGYPNMNMSHFRGRDIVFMGLDGNNDTSGVSSGWMGRFLDEEYPGYPQDYPTPEMPDPIAIEIGSTASIAFHRDDGIPIGLNVQSPQEFYNLINGVGVDGDQLYLPDGYAGDEVEYIWQFEAMSNVYASRLRDVYNAGHNSSVEYPEEYPNPAPAGYIQNPLSGQLQLIARLLSGGIKTRIFMCRIGGFDTHASQVESYDASYGEHAALLYHLSAGIKAFQDDLANLGQEERVLTMTFTEFGRRVASNESNGTDHGTATPVFLFGKALDGKIIGTNPDLTDLDNGNLRYGIDYRQIYTSVVQDWFGGSPEAVDAAGFSEWSGQRLDLFGASALRGWDDRKQGIHCFPNPASSTLNFRFFLSSPTDIVNIKIFDSFGKTVIERKTTKLIYGPQQISIDVSNLISGNYFYQLEGILKIGTGQFVKY
jgi:uncharacterized protein (DUF1501 family)